MQMNGAENIHYYLFIYFITSTINFFRLWYLLVLYLEDSFHGLLQTSLVARHPLSLEVFLLCVDGY